LKNEREGEINKLFDNIKEEMKGLKEKLDNEKRTFANSESAKGCPPDFFINNEKVLETIRKYLSPKENEKNLFGEVFTPLEMVCEMLSKLPANVWKNPSLTWLDPSNGIANFPIIVYYKLMDSLKNVHGLENEKKRSKHIIEKMLYMNELNPVNVALAKKIFKMIDQDAKPNISKGDFIKNYEKLVPEDRDKFDIIIGNPPYNESRIKETSDSPLYSKFIEASLKITDKLLFIVPSRWFIGGKGLNKFRESMLKREDIVLINHIENSKKIWPTVGIAGGVNYFLIDKDYKGLTHFIDEETGRETNIKLDKFDILVPNVSAYPIINKIIDEPKLSEIYLSTGHFGITSNSEHFQDTPGADTLKCYVAKAKGSVKYVDKKYIKQDYKFWKVFTPQGAQGSKTMKDGFGVLIIGKPSEIASQTYFSFKVRSEAEAECLKSYLETKFANYMLSLRKIDQHISENTLLWVPLPPLDREKPWTDEAIYKFYNLTDSDIRIIEKDITRQVNTKTRKNVEGSIEKLKESVKTRAKREKRIGQAKSKKAVNLKKQGGNKLTRKVLSFFSH
jgi:site-specific DNA-methyltransferase (adenine-specific)